MSDDAKAPHDAIPVTLATPVSPPEADRKSQADTTAQALRSQGQREINLIWESTQMKIALSVVFGVMLALMTVVLTVLTILVTRWSHLNETATAVLIAVLTGALSSLTSMGSLVIGFYFGRTNHEKTGGVGGETAGSR